MIKPTIHLNGTSAEVLLDQLVAAGKSLQQTIECLCDAAPNARDYYPQGQSAFGEAQREHQAREQKLREVLVELQALAEHVAEEIDLRSLRSSR
jgi:hypothetical protein